MKAFLAALYKGVISLAALGSLLLIMAIVFRLLD